MKNTPKPEPSQTELHALFDYTDDVFRDDKHAFIGGLLWKPEAYKSRSTVVARLNKYGIPFAGGVFTHPKTGIKYPCISINKVYYLSHRLVWVWHNGDIPSGLIVDHSDRNTFHCRINNLRLVTEAVNKSNKSANRNSTSQYVGVHRSESGRAKPWRARFKQGGVVRFLGDFDTEIEAALARDAAAFKYLGEFGNYNFPELL